MLDAPDRWLDKSIDELLRYRFGLVRGKSTVKVQDARNPDKTLSLVQEMVMSEELVQSPPQQQGVEDLLWSILMLPEFQLVY